LNPTITVIFMAKFNPIITTYLLPYITEGYDNKQICYWMSLLLKVEHISYTLGTCVYTHLPSGLWHPVSVYMLGKALVPMV